MGSALRPRSPFGRAPLVFSLQATVNILAIDTGLHIGYALVDSEEGLWDSGTLEAEENDTYRFLDLLATKADAVVIEDCKPYGTSVLGKQLSVVIEKLRRLFPDAKWIEAPAWKSTVYKHAALPKADTERKRTSHERDAIRIAFWAHSFMTAAP